MGPYERLKCPGSNAQAKRIIYVSITTYGGKKNKKNKCVSLSLYIFSLLFGVNYRKSIGRVSMKVFPTELI